MSLILAISTSSTLFEVMIGDDNSKVLFSDSYVLSITDKKDISVLVSESLAKMNLTPQDIKSIIVDVGPGGTSLVRTGVAFGNGLAYSLGIPICPVLSVELVGIEVWEKYKLPVIITVRSVKDSAYVALYDGKLKTMKYGIMTEVVSDIVADFSEFVVAGAHRDKIIAEFPSKKVHDSGLLNGNPKYLIEKHDSFKDQYVSFPQFAHPITEQTTHIAGNTPSV
jgi:tRNA A37 threonylcarbamoyladenosine modification protein TsaB